MSCMPISGKEPCGERILPLSPSLAASSVWDYGGKGPRGEGQRAQPGETFLGRVRHSVTNVGHEVCHVVQTLAWHYELSVYTLTSVKQRCRGTNRSSTLLIPYVWESSKTNAQTNEREKRRVLGSGKRHRAGCGSQVPCCFPTLVVVLGNARLEG